MNKYLSMYTTNCMRICANGLLWNKADAIYDLLEDPTRHPSTEVRRRAKKQRNASLMLANVRLYLSRWRLSKPNR